MGKDLYDSFPKAKELFEQADRILGFPLFSIMFKGTAGKLRKIIKEGGGDEWVHNPTLLKPKEYRIIFAHPDGSGKKIEWRSIKKSPCTYLEKPLILDLEEGQPIVFSIIHINIACEIYSKYVYRNGAVVLFLTKTVAAGSGERSR